MRLNYVNAFNNAKPVELRALAMRRFARFGTICAILKNVKNTHEGVIL